MNPLLRDVIDQSLEVLRMYLTANQPLRLDVVRAMCQTVSSSWGIQKFNTGQVYDSCTRNVEEIKAECQKIKEDHRKCREANESNQKIIESCQSENALLQDSFEEKKKHKPNESIKSFLDELKLSEAQISVFKKMEPTDAYLLCNHLRFEFHHASGPNIYMGASRERAVKKLHEKTELRQDNAHQQRLLLDQQRFEKLREREVKTDKAAVNKKLLSRSFSSHSPFKEE